MQEKNPLVIAGGVLFLVLGIVVMVFSVRQFSGNAYFNYGLIAFGVILLLTALISRVNGSMGLIVAGLWLIAMGAFNLYHFRFVYDQIFMGIIPILAAILMFFGI